MRFQRSLTDKGRNDTLLTQQRSLKESVKFANLVSAIVVTRKGAQSSIPSFEEVEEYYKFYGESRTNSKDF